MNIYAILEMGRLMKMMEDDNIFFGYSVSQDDEIEVRIPCKDGTFYSITSCDDSFGDDFKITSDDGEMVRAYTAEYAMSLLKMMKIAERQ